MPFIPWARKVNWMNGFFFFGISLSNSIGAPLRLASFNVKWMTASSHETRLAPWRNEVDLSNHRHEVATVLAETVKADIVCLLEVTSRLALEKLVAEPALKKMGYNLYHLESEDTGTGQDIVFLSRVPLDRVQGQEITRFSRSSISEPFPPGTPKSRVHQKNLKANLSKNAIIYLTYGKTKLGILGLHLLAHPDDVERTLRRTLQAKIAADLIREEIIRRGYIPIVLGDLNDFDPTLETAAGFPDPSRQVLNSLKDFDPSRPGQELFNMADSIQPLSHRFSCYWDKNRNGMMDSGDSLSMLDHILLDRSLSNKVLKAEILHAHDGTVSDHWPLVVELNL